MVSRLLVCDALDVEAPFEVGLRADFEGVKDILADAGGNRDAIVDKIVRQGSTDDAAYTATMRGLLYVMLVDRASAEATWSYTAAASTDGGMCIAECLDRLLLAVSHRLLPDTIRQVFFITGKLVGIGAPRSAPLVETLLRLCKGADLTPQNLWVCAAMLDLLEGHWGWLASAAQADVVVSAFFCFVRVMRDLAPTGHTELLDRMVRLCCQIWQTARDSCVEIGRDMVRLLQNVARVPGMDAIWTDVLGSRNDRGGVRWMLERKTPDKLLKSRLLPAAERDLMFLLTEVDLAAAKRHQNWFAARYLGRPESDSLISDLIRVIVCTYHPSNKKLASSIVPRYQVIAWLLKCTRTNVAAGDAKLALYIDWFTFASNADVMYIEPGILLLSKSLKTAPNQTNMLLDFLCFMVNDYHPNILRGGDAPAGGNFVLEGIQGAFLAAKSLKVISSLHNLLTNKFMTKELAGTVQATFPALLPGSAPGRTDLAADGKAGGKKALPASASASAVPQAETEYKGLIAKLGEPYDHNSRSATVEAILLKFCAEEEPPDVALYQRITRALERTLRTSLEGAIPGRIVRAPHAVLFDHVSSTAGWNLQGAQGAAAVAQSGSVGTSTDQRLVVILRGLMEPLPKLGFYFLSHIQTLGRDFVKALGPGLRHRHAREQAIAHTAGLVTAYAALAASFSGTIDCADEELLMQCVFRDLEMCLVQIGNTDAFYALVPFVYDLFPQSTVGITRLLHLVVGYIDTAQVQVLTSKLIAREFTMFRHASVKDGLVELLKMSVGWESMEQLFLWQLLAAEMISTPNCTEVLAALLPALSSTATPEAQAGLIQITGRLAPNPMLLATMLFYDKGLRAITVSVLNCWSMQNPDMLTRALCAYLSKIAVEVGLQTTRVVHTQAPGQSHPSELEIVRAGRRAAAQLEALASIVDDLWSTPPLDSNRLAGHLSLPLLMNLAKEISSDGFWPTAWQAPMTRLFHGLDGYVITPVGGTGASDGGPAVAVAATRKRGRSPERRDVAPHRQQDPAITAKRPPAKVPRTFAENIRRLLQSPNVPSSYPKFVKFCTHNLQMGNVDDIDRLWTQHGDSKQQGR